MQILLRLIRVALPIVALFIVLGVASNASRSFPAKVDRFVYGVDGKPVGLVLTDHSFLQFRPESVVNAQVVGPGDSVYVRGEQVLSHPNRVFKKVLVKKGVDVVVDETGPAPANPPLPEPETPQLTYKSTYDTSSLLAVGVGPDRKIDRLVLRDGTLIKIPKGGFVEKGSALPGERIYVQGVGTINNGTQYIEATNLQGPNQEPILLARGSAGETWKDREGNVKQLLLTPGGLADGVLLTDDSAVRFDPVPANRLTALKPGMPLKVAGPFVEDQLHAGLIYLPRAQRIVDLNVLRPPGPQTEEAGAAAVPLEDKSQVMTFLRTPGGEIETIVLADGAVVKIPPQLQYAASKLKAGQDVRVTGEGGKYLEGTAMIADSLS
jgi:hypothetical protein